MHSITHKKYLIGIQKEDGTVFAVEFNYGCNMSSLLNFYNSKELVYSFIDDIKDIKSLFKCYPSRNDFLDATVQYTSGYLFVQDSYWIYTDGLNLSVLK